MKKLLQSAAALIALSIGAAAVSVTVTQPANYAQVSSPFTLAANASSSYPITGWQVYVDGTSAYSAGSTNSINASISAAVGTHQVITRAWDSSGAYGSYTQQITVISGGGTGVTVTITAPGNGGQVSSPFNLVASASSGYQITGWAAYLDGLQVYSAGSTNSINTNVSAGNGNHQLVVRAWNTAGNYGDTTESITVTGGGGGNGLPTPPSNAIWFYDIQNRSNWSYCHDPGCAGGSGSGSYWMAQHQSSPSRSGSSTQFYNSGVWANALWWQKVGPNNGVHNFLWDFWIYLDSASQTAGQALEFDAFQFVGGYNYMIGSQCDYGSGTWDTWDESSGHWMHSSISCPKFSPNAWHHIQWYLTTDTGAHTYTYHTLVVDGQGYTVNKTYSAKNLHWADNIGVQWQVDVNATGHGYNEWLDSASLAIW